MVSPAAFTLTQFLSDVTLIVTSGFDWAQSAMNWIVVNPIAIAAIGLPLIGLGIGFVSRLIRA